MDSNKGCTQSYCYAGLDLKKTVKVDLKPPGTVKGELFCVQVKKCRDSLCSARNPSG